MEHASAPLDCRGRPLRSLPDPASLRRATGWWLAATTASSSCVLLVLQDLGRSNRPHELDNAPWVAGLALVSLVLSARAFAELLKAERFRRRGAGRGATFHFLALGLVAVTGLSTLLLVGALSALPAVLGD